MELENARHAYEAAKMLERYFQGFADAAFPAAAKLIVTNATTAYEAAMLADAQAKLDAMGVVIGETMVAADGFDTPFRITKLFAHVRSGKCYASDGGDGYRVELIRPYVAPVVKEMVLFGPTGEKRWSLVEFVPSQPCRLTLSGITPANLDAMKPGDVIEGSYKIERMK